MNLSTHPAPLSRRRPPWPVCTLCGSRWATSLAKDNPGTTRHKCLPKVRNYRRKPRLTSPQSDTRQHPRPNGPFLGLLHTFGTIWSGQVTRLGVYTHHPANLERVVQNLLERFGDLEIVSTSIDRRQSAADAVADADITVTATTMRTDTTDSAEISP